MGLQALKGKKTRKKNARAKARTGLAGVPIDKGFDAVKEYFHLQVDRKDCLTQTKTWIKKNFPEPAKYILSHPEWKFNMTHHAATAFWYNNDLYKNNDLGGDKAKEFLNSLFDYVIPLIETGKELYKKKQAEKKTNVIVLTIQEKMTRKIRNTIMQELLELEDKWIDGEDATINIYDRFKFHGLTNAAVSHVKPMIEGWLLDYEDAYHKRCDQAVEGYSHLKRSVLNHRIKVCKEMLSDLDRIKSASKASRNVKIKGSVAIDKQVSKVQYKKEDTDFKIVSINPIQIPNKHRLYTFNCKYKVITEYVTDSPSGFIISGSTIKNFNKATSRAVTLRKPDELLPIFLTKSPKQIDEGWKTVTTKTFAPNGRINKDTILLRVLDR
tara:strand:- start:9 stop:1154 length:1146 start_codon:yes stop_codon:yes gene_type:complete